MSCRGPSTAIKASDFSVHASNLHVRNLECANFGFATVPLIALPLMSRLFFVLHRLPTTRFHLVLAHPPLCQAPAQSSECVGLTCKVWRHRVGQVWRPKQALLQRWGREMGVTATLSRPVPPGEFKLVDSQTENATKLN